jgi:hypothetical protein
MDDPRWEPGMPVLDRQAGGSVTLPPSLRVARPRSVPEVVPTPLQRQYINLSVIALIAGAVGITALEAGVPMSNPLVKVCALVTAAILLATTADASVRIWRSAWAWMPVDRGRALFRLSWLAAAGAGLALIVVVAGWVLSA